MTEGEDLRGGTHRLKKNVTSLNSRMLPEANTNRLFTLKDDLRDLDDVDENSSMFPACLDSSSRLK